jgi:hypothetical protein
VTSVLRLAKQAAELEFDKWKFRRVYTRAHSNFDVECHIREAADWLRRAQDYGNDRGFSYGVKFGGGFLESYPETTGYIIPTFLKLADAYGNEEFALRAVEAGDWEIAVQMECGAVMGGRVSQSPTPAVFNTGQVLLGWAALAGRTGEGRFLEAGRRAADWLVSVQEPDGAWRRGNSQFANSEASVDRYVKAAVKNAEFAVTRQLPNGWFLECCLTDPQRPLLHTVAYTMQGLLELGLLEKRDDFVDAARKTADCLVDVLRADGFLAGRLNPDFSDAVDWCCLTGSAQTSIVFTELGRLTGQLRYREAARRINRYLMARHDIFSHDPVIRGGLAGSWPVWGDYGQFMVLNWATKFLIDALLAEREFDRAA